MNNIYPLLLGLALASSFLKLRAAQSEAGPPLVNLGPRVHKVVIWIVGAVVILLSLLMFRDWWNPRPFAVHPPFFAPVLFLTMGVTCLWSGRTFHLGRFSDVTERGLLLWITFVPWGQVKAYEWKQEGLVVLKTDKKTIPIRVGTKAKSKLHDLLKAHVGEAALSST